MRVDLFSTIHKGVRTLLFELSTEAARVDVTSTASVDGLVCRVERVLAFLDEHARLEDTFVWPVVRALDPDLGAELAADHRGLDVVQTEVCLAMQAVALADLSQRPVAGAGLVRVINHLVAVQLLHMNREETEVNATLWSGRADGDLVELRTRMTGSLPPERRQEWLAIITPALNPVERRFLGGPAVG